ncbi:Uu.00g127540.m01.CDS01 [Anthostomella pinea]|uniref:Uu.00g127540.m01.CDS01 n=1 Tax=Anthostomella pinea TaxID=933095 RepID=A0AAI8VI60_9PEZI|nr:Uu.00g127540.m01.CDS01 [Anthostomella pinea]
MIDPVAAALAAGWMIAVPWIRRVVWIRESDGDLRGDTINSTFEEVTLALRGASADNDAAVSQRVGRTLKRPIDLTKEAEVFPAG